MDKPSRGALIAFEGCDRSGKSTQARLLIDKLRTLGSKTELMPFPDRTTDLGRFLDQYLKGKVEMEPKEAHLAFAANRQAAVDKMKRKLQDGYHIITDRYTYSGIAYTLAKKGMNMGLEWAKLQDVGILRPDCVLFFDLSPGEAEKRSGFGDEVLEAMDIQHRVYDVFQKLASENKDIWKTVDASLSVEDLANDVWNTVEPVLNSVAFTPLRLIDTEPPCCPSL